MALIINFYGLTSDYATDAFFNSSPTSTSATQVVYVDSVTGFVTTFTGTGFAFDASGNLTAGTLTGWTTVNGSSQTVADVSGASWSAPAFQNALTQAVGFGNMVPMNALLSQQDISFDGSLSDRDFFWSFDGVTSNVDFVGSGFNDTLTGGAGDDSIWGGDGNDWIIPGLSVNRNEIIGGNGNDTIDFSTATSGGGNEIVYRYLLSPITVNIDGPSNTATVNKGPGGTDTIVNIQNALSNATRGFDIVGTAGNDVFNVTSIADSWMGIAAGEGNDTYNLTLNDTIRLKFLSGANGNPTQGVVMNLVTGVVSNDGFGTTDQINILGGSERLEIEGSSFADSITGSARSEIFRLGGGNDTVNAAGGDYDLLRLDQSEFGAVSINLAAGTATGSYNGTAFTKTVTGFEEALGSDFNDTITGNSADNWLDGREGNDSLIGGAGDDTLRGDAGNDTLRGGAGKDNLSGGDGNDLIDASGGDVASQSWGDFIRPGLGHDTILGHAGLWASGEGADINYGGLSGIGGLTIAVGANGTGTAVSGDGRVNDTFTYIHYFGGSQDADHITGSDEDRWEGFQGHAGNDTIDGGGGQNQMDYRWETGWNGHVGGPVSVDLFAGTAIDTYGDTDTLININRVRGTTGNDTMTAAGLGSDVIFQGDEGNDLLTGGDGNDWFNGGAGNDTIDGGAGDRDGIDYGWEANEGGPGMGVVVDVNAGTVTDTHGNTDTVSNVEQFRGTGQGDSMSAAGTTSGFRFEGGGGNDTLIGGGGIDNLIGGDGDDFLNGGFNDGDYDLINTGRGNDTVSFADATANSYFHIGHWDLDARIIANINGNAGTGSINKGANGTDTYLNLATAIAAQGDEWLGGIGIVGTQYDDIFNVTARDGSGMLLRGEGGNNTYNLGAANPFILRLSLNTGDQGVVANLATGVVANNGFGGTDTITGPGHFTEIQTGHDNDRVTGSARDESFILRAGNDTVFAGGGRDLIRYDRDGAGPVLVDLASKSASGTWSGNAFSHSLNSIENIAGSSSSDLLSGNGFANEIKGNDGNDTIQGRAGNDTLSDGAGNDSVLGGDGNDLFIGGSGADTFDGGAGRDRLKNDVSGATPGSFAVTYNLLTGDLTNTVDPSLNDRILNIEEIEFKGDIDVTIIGNGAANVFLTDLGDDTVRGGGGNDRIEGHGGNDSLLGQAGADTLLGGAGADTLSGNRGNDRLEGGDGNDLILGLEDNDLIFGQAGADTLLGGIGNDTISGNRGVDRIFGGNGADLLNGQEDGDFVFGGAGNDTVKGGIGNDMLAGGGQADRLLGEGGNDTLFGNAGNDLLLGNGGRDRLEAHAGADTLKGGDGNDTLKGGLGNDRLEGGNQNDVLKGGDGADRLFGGNGNDTLDGGAGNDTMTGGAGADGFVFAPGGGGDLVTAYQTGIDHVRLDDALWTATQGTLTAAQVMSTFGSVVAGNVVLDFGSGDVLTLDASAALTLAQVEGDLVIF